jgi:hypothetical protein
MSSSYTQEQIHSLFRSRGMCGQLLDGGERVCILALGHDGHPIGGHAIAARTEDLVIVATGGAVVEDQPPPVATDRRPAWDIVIAHTELRRSASAYGTTGVVDRVIIDMRERDRVGRARYGTPLTSGNGRDNLVDAYQESLDLAVYIAAELDEHSIGPETNLDGLGGAAITATVRWRLHCLQQLFHDAVNTVIRLRAWIEERPG